MQVGVIGFGRLGKLISGYMSQDANVLVYDIENKKEEIEKIGAKAATLEEVCQCSIVIPFVPISEMQGVLKEIAPLLKEGTLVADVCSVKKLPVDWMKEHLPENVSLLATHPMFGPDSAAKTLFGAKIVLCQVRIEDKLYTDITSYLESHGMKVLHSTPEEHDQQISHSLLLTHFIGRSLMDFGAEKLDIDTKGYRRLMKILETVENDSWQLFEDMNKYNPYADETRDAFIKSLSNIDGRIKS